jgi:hypothetical protein
VVPSTRREAVVTAPESGEQAAVVGVLDQPRLAIVPVYWREAKAFVQTLHRHHLPGGNGRFCIGVEDETGTLRGVCVLGRTKARMLPHKHVLEAMRVATDGCPNACSALYGATCRLHKPHGYRKACTYILVSEPGTTLRAAGWRPVALSDGGSWSRDMRKRTDKHPTEPKIRWECRCTDLPSIDLDAAQHAYGVALALVMAAGHPNPTTERDL